MTIPFRFTWHSTLNKKENRWSAGSSVSFRTKYSNQRAELAFDLLSRADCAPNSRGVGGQSFKLAHPRKAPRKGGLSHKPTRRLEKSL
jgi:hypothetical protein